ncbi:MAG: aminotransferase class I/II-fold pyridoxal phosphate-dependent enzyme [Proteobacteria bacterium]|nr:aminotransferase class I/II-fold pyridoxal phosphate-dependent enzyme [Desulfobacula sp.]MBU4129553.1 aminotransferase class I/II-fold pyridoxal phosphate-dependent enzyme [Pseudomonadota bacterium]
MSLLDFNRLVPAHIQSFEVYVPSKPDTEFMRLYGVDHLYRLNNNENALGPPPEVFDILQAFPPRAVPVYPNGDCFDLRNVLAEKFNKDPEQFLVGNGSCEVIASVIKAFCQEGDNIITADKTFAVYEWVAQFSGFEAKLVPLKDHAFDLDAMILAMDDRTKILFVCNPNNPTGTYWNTTTMTDFLDRVDNRALVVIDEAYCEYVEAPDFPDGLALMERYPNVIVFRTFSKMYALASLRIGYLCGALDVVNMVRRTHVVYSVNTLAQRSAAAALSNDGSFIRDTRKMVGDAKALVCPLLEELGLDFLCNQGNYLMVHLPFSDTLMYRKLMTKGIMVRTMTGFRFPNWIRVSLVQMPVMEEFCVAFQQIIQEMRPQRG